MHRHAAPLPVRDLTAAEDRKYTQTSFVEKGTAPTRERQLPDSTSPNSVIMLVCVCLSVSLSLALFPTAPFCLPAVFRWTIGLIFSYMKMVTSSHGEGVVGLRQTWSWLTPGGHQLSSVNPEKKDLPQHLCK